MSVSSNNIARAYYNKSPTNTHATGDIWRGLPTFGLLPRSEYPGLVITPACDLANRKVETVTYLPVMPVDEYILTPAFYPEVRSTLRGCLDSLQLRGLSEDLPTFPLPLQETLNDIERTLAESEQAQRQPPLAARCRAGIAILRKMANKDLSTADIDLVGFFKTREWNAIRDGIVTNSYRPYIHFLPPDGEATEWSAVARGSVALFRYPVTMATELLDVAQETSTANWEVACTALRTTHAIANLLPPTAPLKCLRLNQPFLSDLLTRFLALYIRFGSPDFTPDALASLSIQIGR